ncbi:hypothetical protein BpHYR1_003454 [Brachionus plicatilis]|uniref:Uncharacterized protein n=1 Tax=Brachionus plicatilis TaxID=10195 RepID=A0A3M7TBG1_BRAPC|nr:hypothetical protein BpHYR1_003454 [Brachionus plicatilis]
MPYLSISSNIYCINHKPRALQKTVQILADEPWPVYFGALPDFNFNEAATITTWNVLFCKKFKNLFKIIFIKFKTFPPKFELCPPIF